MRRVYVDNKQYASITVPTIEFVFIIVRGGERHEGEREFPTSSVSRIAKTRFHASAGRVGRESRRG